MQNSFKAKICAFISLIILADVLFYAQAVGWVSGLFGMILLGCIVIFNSINFKDQYTQILIGLTSIQAVLLFEKTSLLSLTLMSLGLLTLSFLRRHDWRDNAGLWAKLCLSSILRFIRPLRRAAIAHSSYKKRTSKPGNLETFMRGWFLPCAFSIIFILLFSQANPITFRWFSDLNFAPLINFISITRWLFWLCAGAFICLLIRPKLKPINRRVKQPTKNGFLNWAFSKEAILRSLVIFNILFASQTVLDATYLWGGQTLPNGITYAQYAHKGAYPLIVTALLAAIFVLITKNTGIHTKAIQGLIYLWVAQNIMLVIASIYRTGLYVDMYSLTYLRVAAFIWMGLVAWGLILIIVQSVQGFSNKWLINANVISALSVLYLTSFVNIGGIIAQYNIKHSLEVSGKGTNLDIYYLEEIGTQALPAMEKYAHLKNMSNSIQRIRRDTSHNMQKWRRWTFSEHRILKHSNRVHAKASQDILQKSGWEYDSAFDHTR